MSAAPALPVHLRSRLILVRHGESAFGRGRRYAGHGDTPLTAMGRRQILSLRPRFDSLQPDLVFASDLRRCRETAEILAPGRLVRFSERLRELHFGSWDGLTSEACLRRDPALFKRWMRDPRSIRPPGGETLDELWKRVRRFVRGLVRRYPERILALLTHAGPIRALAAGNPARFWSVEIPPGALLEIVWNGVSEGRSTEP